MFLSREERAWEELRGSDTAGGELAPAFSFSLHPWLRKSSFCDIPYIWTLLRFRRRFSVFPLKPDHMQTSIKDCCRGHVSRIWRPSELRLPTEPSFGLDSSIKSNLLVSPQLWRTHRWPKQSSGPCSIPASFRPDLRDWIWCTVCCSRPREAWFVDVKII